MSSVVTFGKFKGRHYAELPYWYLRWMVLEKHTKAELAEQEMQRRMALQSDVLIEPKVLSRLERYHKASWQRTRKPRESFLPWLNRLVSAALRTSPIHGGRYALPGFVFVFDEDGVVPKLVDVVQQRQYVP